MTSRYYIDQRSRIIRATDNRRGTLYSHTAHVSAVYAKSSGMMYENRIQNVYRARRQSTIFVTLSS